MFFIDLNRSVFTQTWLIICFYVKCQTILKANLVDCFSSKYILAYNFSSYTRPPVHIPSALKLIKRWLMFHERKLQKIICTNHRVVPLKKTIITQMVHTTLVKVQFLKRRFTVPVA